MRLVCWPDINDEIKDYKQYLKGKVLNAGCGDRIINLPASSEVINLDIRKTSLTAIVADLEKIPFEDESFDSTLSIAVLEHCKHPWKVVSEINRTLKTDGMLLCCIPFFQPVHNVPSDYWRMTKTGLEQLLMENGFSIIKSVYTHSFFHVIGWILEDAIKQIGIWGYILVPLFIINYPLSKWFKTRNITTMPSAITVLAKKCNYVV
jgi:SAM-dependent methyltransferase